MAIPVVSVVLPVRNGERFVEAAIGSIMREREPSREMIVVDDGSSDGTPAILAGLRRKDSRIVIASQPATGIVAALERGRRYARAPLVARLDADDIAYPGRLAAQVAAFEADPDLVLLGTALDRIGEAGGRPRGAITYPTEHERIVEILPQANVFSHSSVMMRRKAVEAAGGYRSFFTGAEDYDLWLRLAEQGKVGNLAARLGAYRVHEDSVSARSALRQAFSAALARRCAVIRREGGPDPSMAREEPIDLDAEIPPHEPLAAEIRLFRALAFAEPETFTRRRPTDDDLRLLTAPSLAHAERQLAQAAIANMARLGARPSSLSYPAAIAAVVRLDALRAFRLLFGRAAG
ncbi:MAG: glycosyltransferase [Rhizobiales bacterium]|nr:glycosyltransferase [Hyphomicrobiales bacterium]